MFAAKNNPGETAIASTLYYQRRQLSAHLWHLWFLCAVYKCSYLLTLYLQPLWIA